MGRDDVLAAREASSHSPDGSNQIFERHPGLNGTTKQLPPALIIVMGTSGCGKSTIGADLARKFRIQFIDGDSLHPKTNVEKMSKGIPLDDDDRFPWLNLIRKEAAALTTPEALRRFYDSEKLKDPQQPRAAIVIACSALKKSYRDLLRGTTGESKAIDRSHRNLETYFVYLKGTRELLLERMQARKGHFFAAKMLDSQLATLEEPSEEEEHTEGVYAVNIDASEQEVTSRAVEAVSRGVGLRTLDD